MKTARHNRDCACALFLLLRTGKLHGVLRALVLRFTHPFFDGRIGDGEHSQGDEPHNRREEQPSCAIGGGGDPQVILCDFSQGQSQYQRWARPVVFHHEVADEPKSKCKHDIGDVVVGGKGPDKNQEHEEWDQQ